MALTESEARAVAMKWKDPMESPHDPDPLAEFGRTGRFDTDEMLEILAGIETWERSMSPKFRAEIYALLDYFAEHEQAVA